MDISRKIRWAEVNFPCSVLRWKQTSAQENTPILKSAKSEFLFRRNYVFKSFLNSKNGRKPRERRNDWCRAEEISAVKYTTITKVLPVRIFKINPGKKIFFLFKFNFQKMNIVGCLVYNHNDNTLIFMRHPSWHPRSPQYINKSIK